MDAGAGSRLAGKIIRTTEEHTETTRQSTNSSVILCALGALFLFHPNKLGRATIANRLPIVENPQRRECPQQFVQFQKMHRMSRPASEFPLELSVSLVHQHSTWTK